MIRVAAMLRRLRAKIPKINPFLTTHALVGGIKDRHPGIAFADKRSWCRGVAVLNQKVEAGCYASLPAASVSCQAVRNEPILGLPVWNGLCPVAIGAT